MANKTAVKQRVDDLEAVEGDGGPCEGPNDLRTAFVGRIHVKGFGNGAHADKDTLDPLNAPVPPSGMISPDIGASPKNPSTESTLNRVIAGEQPENRAKNTQCRLRVPRPRAAARNWSWRTNFVVA